MFGNHNLTIETISAYLSTIKRGRNQLVAWDYSRKLSFSPLQLKD